MPQPTPLHTRPRLQSPNPFPGDRRSCFLLQILEYLSSFRPVHCVSQDIDPFCGIVWHCMLRWLWYATAGYGMVWYGMVWYGMVWYGMVWYGMVWYGMVWYGMVWYGMVWYGMVWYGMAWYGVVCWGIFVEPAAARGEPSTVHGPGKKRRVAHGPGVLFKGLLSGPTSSWGNDMSVVVCQ